MKRKMILAISLVLTVSMLTACAGKNGGADTAGQDKNVDPTTEEADTRAEKNQEEPADESKDSNVDASGESMKMYEEFLAGKGTVLVSGVAGYPDGELTLQELIDGHSRIAGTEGMPDAISEGDYAYIDCGNDGEPELALRLEYLVGDGYFAPAIEYLVMRPVFGKLQLITSQEEYYRYGTTMNKYGFFTEWGSGGASLSYYGEAFVSADGEYYQLFSREDYYGLSMLVVTPDALPESLSERLVPEDFGFDDAYSMSAYSFGEGVSYEDYEDDWDAYYMDYARSKYYTFYDMISEEAVMPDQDYVARCEENGIHIYSEAEINEILQEQYDSYGVTEEIRNGEEPDWTSFEVTDKVSKNAQIELLLDNTRYWLLDEQSKADGSVVKYAVTDLNRNGRYELIRSEKLYLNPDNTSFCRNRFFEVNEDYTGIDEMDYETSYIWDDGEGELAGWEHDLLGASEEGYIDCYWYGKEDDGEEKEYYYVIPTLYTTEDNPDYGELKMVLFVKPDGTIPYYNGDLGWKFYTASTDSFSYTDEGGIECSQEMYETGIAETVFSPENGWNRDLVYISFVELEEQVMDDAKAELFTSADAYWYYTEEYAYAE